MDPDAYLSNRLLAALAVSCLLHAAVIAMPYLGASTTALAAGRAESGVRPAAFT